MGAKNYHLVLWTSAEPRTTSVLAEKEVRVTKKKVTAKWGGEWFEATILKTSKDKQFLDNLEVDTEGKIISLSRRESFPDALVLEKRKEAKEKREMIAAKSNASKRLQQAIVSKHSIFSDPSDIDEDEDRRPKNDLGTERQSPINLENRKREHEKDTRQRDKNAKKPKKSDKHRKITGKRDENEPLLNLKQPPKSQGEQGHKNEKDGEQAGGHKDGENEQEHLEAAKEDAQQEREPENEQNRQEAGDDAEQEREHEDGENGQEHLEAEERAAEQEQDDNFEVVRKTLVSDHSEEGKIKLQRGFKIYIDVAELSYLKEAWRSKPKELARRLMKLIVGSKRLKQMTPTGRAGTTAIPKDVFNAVFLYINRKAPVEDKLSHKVYRRVLTNLCNTLRNPKKYEPKKRPTY